MLNKTKILIISFILIISAISFFACDEQYSQIKNASYQAGYNSYTTLKTKADDDLKINNVEEVIETMKGYEDLSAVNWDYFKQGYSDAKEGQSPKY